MNDPVLTTRKSYSKFESTGNRFFPSQDVLFVSRGRKFASFLPNNRENGREEKFENTSGQQIGRAQLLRDTPWKTKIRSAPIFGSG